MRTLFLWIAVATLFYQTAISQNAVHKGGGHFLKRIEYNINAKADRDEPGRTEANLGNEKFIDVYNLKSKSIYERVFFGNANFYVEFMSLGAPKNIYAILAFCIIKDSQDSYKLKVMQIPDNGVIYYSAIIKDLTADVSKIDIPGKWLPIIPAEILDSISKHNKEVAIKMRSDELFKPYRPESKEYQVSKEFAEKLHDTMVMLNTNFKGEGVPPVILDGYIVTYRCVVGDEVWTLTIHIPNGKAQLLYDICQQIITDANNNEINESKYIEQLDRIQYY